MKSGSISRLVERLTHPTWIDVGYRDSFLLTFRSFTSPSALLSLLIERFHSRSEEMAQEKDKVDPIQLRVMGVLKAWAEQMEDFVVDSELALKLDTLFQGIWARYMKIDKCSLFYPHIFFFIFSSFRQRCRELPVSESICESDKSGNPKEIPRFGYSSEPSVVMLSLSSLPTLSSLSLISFIYSTLSSVHFLSITLSSRCCRPISSLRLTDDFSSFDRRFIFGATCAAALTLAPSEMHESQLSRILQSGLVQAKSECTEPSRSHS